MCGMMCGILFGKFQEVRHVSRKSDRKVETAYNTTKTALKRESQGRKLVAGAGFEPTTFRL
jgi:hypothetical protein